MSRARARLAAIALASAPWLAHAGMGLVELAPRGDDGPVTVFHPTDAADRPVRKGPFMVQAAPDAAPRKGNGRLVLLSHGSGGTPWVYTDLARALVDAGFVVAVPRHRGDHAEDQSGIGPPSWRERPAELARAIDAVAADPRLAPLLALDRVGVYGMSAGGHAALTLAGGRWSAARLRNHCEAHLEQDFAACAGPSVRLRGDWLDGTRKTVTRMVLRWHFADATLHAHRDPRIAAVVAAVPHAAGFDADSLATPAVPLGLVTAQADRWLVTRFHAGRILQACLPRCEHVADLPTGGHGALLSPAPPPELLGDVVRELLADPPGFDRATLPALHRRTADFFLRHLAAPAS